MSLAGIAGTAHAQTTCSGSEIFTCNSVPPVEFGTPVAYDTASQYFPQSWDQLQYSQGHNPVYPLVSGAPSYLSKGEFWAAPLTGDEFLRLARGYSRYGTNGGENWGSEAAQWLGNVTGISVAKGIIYAEESRNQIWALDAATGKALWVAKTVNANMGDALVETINNRPVVFVAAGDVGFTLQHAVDFASTTGGNPPGKTTRGANFSAVYAFDGLTGKQLWRFDTAGEAMPTPAYKNGDLFFNTGDGHLYAVNATTGTLVSKFNSPGFSSMSSTNWYETPNHHLLIIYGTQDSNELVAVDETNPAAPTMAWEYQPPGSVNTGVGDVPPGTSVDQGRGLVITDSLVRVNGVLNIDLFAVDARTGKLAWHQYMGSGTITPFSFKGSVPMIHNVNGSGHGAVFVGDLLNQTYQSYDETNGKLRWSTDLTQTGNCTGCGPNAQGTIHQPRGGGAWWDGKVIEAEGRDIRTFDPNTGQVLNTFTDPGYFGVWGITSPVIVGNEMYLGSISGWVFAAPAKFITTNQGSAIQPFPPSDLTTPPLSASYSNPGAVPTDAQKAGFPATCLASAGGQEHNSVFSSKLGGLSWHTALGQTKTIAAEDEALPLNAPPRDEGIYGPEAATEMTTLAYGAGSGVCAANGIVYVGGNRYSVNAINATTGQTIWTFPTVNGNRGGPIVTPNTVVVSGGDQWFNFAQVQKFAANDATVHLGASFSNLHGLDPATGTEKWTFYTSGTDAMTPLYDNGNLYWVNGSGNVWAINADTGKTFAPFEDSSGNPTLHIGGMNAIDSANVYHQQGGPDIMVVGTAKPSEFYGIDLSTDKVLWKQTLPNIFYTGFAASSPVVDQTSGLVIGNVLADASGTSVTSEAFALDAKTGAVAWTRSLGSGAIPYGFTAATPVLSATGNRVFFADPVTKTEVALNAMSGASVWTSPLGQMTKAPGTIVGNNLIQPAGPNLYTFSTKDGQLINTYHVGGSFEDNAASVVGGTLYIGNGWGWAMALPLSVVTGGH